MAKISAAKPHFLRCLKPNREQLAGKFDTNYVMSQLRYTGLSETVTIRRMGFPVRVPFEDFLTR
jgi:myosin heavy subunit